MTKSLMKHGMTVIFDSLGELVEYIRKKKDDAFDYAINCVEEVIGGMIER